MDKGHASRIFTVKLHLNFSLLARVHSIRYHIGGHDEHNCIETIQLGGTFPWLRRLKII